MTTESQHPAALQRDPRPRRACSFCNNPAVSKCSSAACKAIVCDKHGSIVGTAHVHTRNPKDHIVFQRILCDRCNGVSLYPNLELTDGAHAAK